MTLVRLLEACRAANIERRITGLLLYIFTGTAGHFIQVSGLRSFASASLLCEAYGCLVLRFWLLLLSRLLRVQLPFKETAVF